MENLTTYPKAHLGRRLFALLVDNFLTYVFPFLIAAALSTFIGCIIYVFIFGITSVGTIIAIFAKSGEGERHVVNLYLSCIMLFAISIVGLAISLILTMSMYKSIRKKVFDLHFPKKNLHILYVIYLVLLIVASFIPMAYSSKNDFFLTFILYVLIITSFNLIHYLFAGKPLTNTTYTEGLLLLLPFGYYFTKDGFNGGQSYGKKLTGLKVLNIVTNRGCEKNSSFLRTFILVFLSIVEGFYAMIQNEGRRLGDFAAKTQVIEIETNYETFLGLIRKSPKNIFRKIGVSLLVTILCIFVCAFIGANNYNSSRKYEEMVKNLQKQEEDTIEKALRGAWKFENATIYLKDENGTTHLENKNANGTIYLENNEKAYIVLNDKKYEGSWNISVYNGTDLHLSFSEIYDFHNWEIIEYSHQKIIYTTEYGSDAEKKVAQRVE